MKAMIAIGIEVEADNEEAIKEAASNLAQASLMGASAGQQTKIASIVAKYEAQVSIPIPPAPEVF